MDKFKKIFIAGHNGMVGSAILRKLINEGFKNILTCSSKNLDLRSQNEVQKYFDIEKPEYVIIAAAKVGGIYANNKYRAEFIYDNLMIEANLIHNSFLHGVKKLLFLGSSCIYPKYAKQPIKEEYLLDGFLESTNQPYAIAKIAGIELCESYRRQYGCNFISAMPTNLYGPNDNFDLETSHVIPAIMRKFISAKRLGLPNVEIWGTGMPRREFLHVNDLADACYFLMQTYNEAGHVNVGTGKDISIYELVDFIKEIVDYSGDIVWDKTKPDGVGKKLLDVSKITELGWKPKISLKRGLKELFESVENLF